MIKAYRCAYQVTPPIIVVFINMKNLMNITKIVANKFNLILSEMSTMSSLFSLDSSKDFTRNRIFTFKETLTTILGMAGGSLNREIYDHFKTTKVIPAASAFVQARAKVSPEAFEMNKYSFAQKKSH